MRILHTSDWHLGASLGSFSRIDEQREFLTELADICRREQVDLILLAGDVFDNSNPSAAAYGLYCAVLKELAGIPVIITAGNHDNPERLAALAPLAEEVGHVTVALPAAECIEITVSGEAAVIAALPFVSEKRLNELVFDNEDESGMAKNYSDKIAGLYVDMSAKFRKDAVSIVIGHFHLERGEASGSERDITLGGIYAVSRNSIPDADYVALGHLHRPQEVSANGGKAYYSGSPLYYSLSERAYQKSVVIVEAKAGEAAQVRRVPLKSPRPIELWEADTTAEMLVKCAENENSLAWVYILIKEEASLNHYDIKEMRRLVPFIIEIRTELDNQDHVGRDEFLEERSLNEEFIDFYTKRRGIAPDNAMREIFAEIMEMDDL